MTLRELSKLAALASDKLTGWKIVSWDGEKLRSLADSFLIYDISEGDVVSNSDGFYLGTSKEFVQDYYSGLNDYSDALISFKYNESDVISGSPREEGEVKVLKAIVSSIDILD
mgnify:CR=1 FL=1|tara:strand:- start:1250 stop:1588 length:339 start_codon:yes stop_codon:yes gene_type:complete